MSKAEKEYEEAVKSKAKSLTEEKRLALAKAKQRHLDRLAKQKEALENQKRQELSKAETEFSKTLAANESKLKADKRRALSKAQQTHKSKLAAQKSKLDSQKVSALAASKQSFTKKLDHQKELTAQVKSDLLSFEQAAEAKKKIVEQLNKNFKNFDTTAVEIDRKTGKVKLNFQDAYFVRGSHVLSQDMKNFLRIMIPKYAKSIYENKEAAQHVQSLKISGMTSPVHKGVYIDVNDTSPETETARQFNMALSNKRAIAMYNFIFDRKEMSDYKYLGKLKSDMSIQALGFQKSKPVQPELVGKIARCIKYNCKKEQATILQFHLFSDE